MEFYKSRNFARKKNNNRFDSDKISSYRNSKREQKFSSDKRRNDSAIVTCADCGIECEIPFVPKHDRPVYCSDCFKQNKPNTLENERSPRNNRSTRFSSDKRRNDSAIVTCADCGIECEIPFVPKHDRPVYCSDCFKQNKPNTLENERSPRNNRSTRFSKKRESSFSSDHNNRKINSKSEKISKKQDALFSGGSEKFYASLKEKLFDILGGKICSNCGFRDERALGVCHISDDSVFDNIQRGGFASSWGKYISEPALARQELRVLCLNCNEIRQPISKPKKEENQKSKRKKSRYFPR